jgi:hypothetical protein
VIQSKPNSYLLTVADSPSQQHQVASALGTNMIAKNQRLSDQQATIYAVSAYSVRRAKDRIKEDFWKLKYTSRGITSSWSAFNQYQKKISDEFRKSKFRSTTKVDVTVKLNFDDGDIDFSMELDPKLKIQLMHSKKSSISISYEAEEKRKYDLDRTKDKGKGKTSLCY